MKEGQFMGIFTITLIIIGFIFLGFFRGLIAGLFLWWIAVVTDPNF